MVTVRWRPRVRVVIAALAVVVLALLAWAAISAWLARGHLVAARDDLAAVQAHPPEDVATLQKRLAADRSDTRAARGLMHQVGPVVVSWVPLLGRALDAERAVADAADVIVSAGTLVSGRLEDLTSTSRVDPERLRALAGDLDVAARQARGPVAALAGQSVGLLPGSVARQVRDAQAKLVPLGRALPGAAEAVRSAVALFGGDGPRTILVALENNAELRGTGGLVSSYAIATSRDGRLEIGPFQDVAAVSDEAAKATRVPAPGWYVERFGAFAANSTLWKNTNMAADGPTSMQVMAEVARASLPSKPDMVLLIDVPAMAAIVESTGNVVRLPDGSTVGGEDLVHALLVQSYGPPTTDDATQERRRLALQRAAGDVVARVARSRPGVSLLKALASAAGERHIQLWSAQPGEQRGFVAGGVAGAVDPQGADIAMVTANNLGDSPGTGNKLDYYVHRDLRVSVEVSRDRADVTQTLTLRNEAPAALSSYVAGVKHPGRLNELVDLAAASSSALQGFTHNGQPADARVLAGVGARQVSSGVILQRGQTMTIVLRYVVPLAHGRYRLLAIPQPLARAATLRVDVTAAEGVELSGGPLHRAGPWQGVVRVDVGVHKPSGWRARLSRFWNQKVSL